MNDPAVEVINAAKRFKLYRDIIMDPIKEQIFFWRRERYFEPFWAVRNASLTVQRGDVVGIIGPNGAGKTTLLKMIAGLLKPDRGSIRVSGEVTALLVLGVGFHPEFTGRENIFYGGLVLGMSKQEILGKMDEIIEFSELGEFIDRPLRTYSSGMKARLNFSVSMSIDPDILIVDEALSTGDIGFVNKCLARIQTLCESGATILFVSHNLRQIERLCRRALVMQRGEIIYDGEPERAIEAYIDSMRIDGGDKLEEQNRRRSGNRQFQGSGDIEVTDIYFTVAGERSSSLVIGKPCDLVIEYRAARAIPAAKLFLWMVSEKSPVTYAFLPPIDPLVGETDQPFEEKNVISISAGKRKTTLHFSPFTAGDGKYYFDLSFFPAERGYQFSPETSFCHYKRIIAFHAVYENKAVFGRGTMSELAVSSIENE